MKIVIDNTVVDEYTKYYFMTHPRASKIPIKEPYHPSINEWCIMKRPLMNSVKQKWKNFIVWFVKHHGYANLRIDKCEIDVVTYYKTNRRHDPDNSIIKFILDGFTDGGLIIDDDSSHILKLSLKCLVDTDNPRTEIFINEM